MIITSDPLDFNFRGVRSNDSEAKDAKYVVFWGCRNGKARKITGVNVCYIGLLKLELVRGGAGGDVRPGCGEVQ